MRNVTRLMGRKLSRIRNEQLQNIVDCEAEGRGFDTQSNGDKFFVFFLPLRKNLTTFLKNTKL